MGQDGWWAARHPGEGDRRAVRRRAVQRAPESVAWRATPVGSPVQPVGSRTTSVRAHAARVLQPTCCPDHGSKHIAYREAPAALRRAPRFGPRADATMVV